MRMIPAILLASVGSLAFAGAVAAKSLPVHTTTVQLPDGSAEVIHYVGNVAPRVTFLPDATASFAALDRLSYEMDREAAAMFNGMMPLAALPVPNPQMFRIDMSSLPAGARGYEVMTTLAPGSSCTESVEITSTGPGAQPHVVTQRSGNCGGQGAATPQVGSPYIAPVAPPTRIISVRADQARPSREPVRVASLQGIN